MTNDNFERRFRDSDVVRNSLAITFQLIVDIFATFGAAQNDADQTNAKVAALDKDGWLQLKLSPTLVRHLKNKKDQVKVAGDQLGFATRAKQQRKGRSNKLVEVLFTLAHFVGAQSCRPY